MPTIALVDDDRNILTSVSIALGRIAERDQHTRSTTQPLCSIGAQGQ